MSQMFRFLGLFGQIENLITTGGFVFGGSPPKTKNPTVTPARETIGSNVHYTYHYEPVNRQFLCIESLYLYWYVFNLYYYSIYMYIIGLLSTPL